MDINEQKREQVINYLAECFSKGVLTLDDYERRLEIAHSVRTLRELDALVVDLQTVPERRSARRSARSEEQRVMAILTSRELSGNWLKKGSVLVQSIMGSVECDLRHIQLFPLTRIQIFGLMSEITIIVPQEASVVNNISPILSETREKNWNTGTRPAPPVIELNGIVVMSEIKVKN